MPHPMGIHLKAAQEIICRYIVACPSCGAKKGERCKTIWEANVIHLARVDALEGLRKKKG